MSLLLQTGVVSGGAPLALLEALVLFVAAIVLLDEDGSSAALLESFLLVVGPELGLDQDGRLGHLLVESVLRKHSGSVSGAGPLQTSRVITASMLCRYEEDGPAQDPGHFLVQKQGMFSIAATALIHPLLC